MQVKDVVAGHEDPGRPPPRVRLGVELSYEVNVVDWFSTSATPGRLILVGAILFVLGLSWPVGRALVVWAQGRADVARIKETGKVLVDLAKVEPDQADRLRTRLERVRPPPPDEIEPPAASSG
jgi:hypothetical protein